MLKTFRQLFGILDRRERIQAVFVFLFSIVVAGAEVVGVASILPFMSAVSNPESVTENPFLATLREWFGFLDDEEFIIALGLGVIALLLTSLAVRAIGIWVQVKFSTLRSHSVSYRLMKAYLHQPYQWYLNQHTARMSTSVLSEAAQVINGALFPAMQMITKLLIVLSLFGLLVVTDPALALIAVTVIGFAYGAIYMLSRKTLSILGQRRHRANQKRYRVVQESFGGIKDLFIIGREAQAVERFRLASQNMAKHIARARVTAELPPLAMQGLIFSGMIAIVIYFLGVYGSVQNALPVLSLFALAGYRLMPELQAVYRHLTEIRVTESVLDSVYNDLRRLEQTSRPMRGADVKKWPGLEEPEIRFRQVFYAYPGADRKALADINLTIRPYSTVGIVGPTGSGKTTLVDVLLGLLSPERGELIIGGVAIDSANIRSWQDKIGYVPQQIFLTDNTVAGNIAFGIEETDIDQAAVEKAARIANLHDFIMSELPEGYQTRIGEKGVRLSGGQRQRIGIARALYHDPGVLILDEATSALDNLTERAVMDAVNRLSKKKTIILIAHRLSTVQACDEIVLMEAGRISATGRYDELVESNSVFREMTSHI
ncbi:ABC transporter ATP-binding protein [Marinobacter lipolyticus]|uniref:ABC transporter ATP-binding protein n=1 Tax=Marinobacter lipolyticus TaxID=209639 RepID=UPI001BCFDBFC|nr:ABC transporter ATP-binding protein [Marinobacter lipolyticus]MBS8238962.1 ABC transporter ATP-binding protein [Marinobacter lipolyticus]